MAIPPPDRIRVTDHERWGLLVKSWSTGQNKLNDGNTYTKPVDLADVVRQCAMAGVGLHLPSYVRSFRLVEYQKEEFVLKLPPADMVVQSETAVQSGIDYPLPDFYADAYPDQVAPYTQAKPRDPLKFNSQRIGDYTINNCGM